MVRGMKEETKEEQREEKGKNIVLTEHFLRTCPLKHSSSLKNNHRH
jgi:hypothetical protein